MAAIGSKVRKSIDGSRPSTAFSSASVSDGFSARISVSGEITVIDGSPLAISRPTALPVSASMPPGSTTIRPLRVRVTPSSVKAPLASV